MIFYFLVLIILLIFLFVANKWHTAGKKELELALRATSKEDYSDYVRDYIHTQELMLTKPKPNFPSAETFQELTPIIHNILLEHARGLYGYRIGCSIICLIFVAALFIYGIVLFGFDLRALFLAPIIPFLVIVLLYGLKVNKDELLLLEALDGKAESFIEMKSA